MLLLLLPPPPLLLLPLLTAAAATAAASAANFRHDKVPKGRLKEKIKEIAEHRGRYAGWTIKGHETYGKVRVAGPDRTVWSGAQLAVLRVRVEAVIHAAYGNWAC